MSGESARGRGRDALIDALGRELGRVSSQSALFGHAVAELAGMHSTDIGCLGFLLDEGPVTAQRLAEVTGLTTGAVTRMVDRLERAGYVRRRVDTRDRRRVIVEPLRARAREIAPLFQSMERAMADLYARYTDEQLALIVDFVGRAATVVQEQTTALQRNRKPMGRRAASGRTTPAEGAR